MKRSLATRLLFSAGAAENSSAAANAAQPAVVNFGDAAGAAGDPASEMQPASAAQAATAPAAAAAATAKAGASAQPAVDERAVVNKVASVSCLTPKCAAQCRAFPGMHLVLNMLLRAK